MSFNQNQLGLIQKARSDLRLLPNNTDIFVMEFLRIYDIDAQPTDIGVWNGWDTLAALDDVLDLYRPNHSIRSSVFYASKSMQVSQASKQAAEDWTSWKRWALDHKEFKEFKNNRLKEIEKFNSSILEKINSAELKEELEKIVKDGEASERFFSSYKYLKFLLHGFSGYFYVLLLTKVSGAPTIASVVIGQPIISLFTIEVLIPKILAKRF